MSSKLCKVKNRVDLLKWGIGKSLKPFKQKTIQRWYSASERLMALKENLEISERKNWIIQKFVNEE